MSPEIKDMMERTIKFEAWLNRNFPSWMDDIESEDDINKLADVYNKEK